MRSYYKSFILHSLNINNNYLAQHYDFITYFEHCPDFYSIIHGNKISAEQKLMSVSDEVNTKLGKGRYWVIEVTYKNESNNLVGKQNIHFLGYKK